MKELLVDALCKELGLYPGYYLNDRLMVITIAALDPKLSCLHITARHVNVNCTIIKKSILMINISL